MSAMSLALFGVLVALGATSGAIKSSSAHVLTSSTQGEKTVMGCTCDGPCGATEDFGLADCDWCYTKDKCGHFSFSRDAHYDYCIYPPNASTVVKSSKDKLNDLWQKITADTTSGGYPNVAGILAESIQTTFDDVSFIFFSQQLDRFNLFYV